MFYDAELFSVKQIILGLFCLWVWGKKKVVNALKQTDGLNLAFHHAFMNCEIL